MNLTPRRALAWSLAERYGSFLVTLGSTMLLARLLTPTQVGIYSMCAALLAVAAILRDFGTSEYLIQAREPDPQRLRAAWCLALLTAWTLAALIWFVRHALAAWFGEPQVAAVLAVMALQFVLLPLSSPAFALLNRALAFRRIFWLQTANNISTASVAVVLALLGWGPLALAAGPLAGVLMQTLLIGWLAPRGSFPFPWPTALLQHGREVLRYGLAYMGARLIETLGRNVHEPVIARRFDFEAVGLYSRAQGLVEMFHTHVAEAVVRVSTPAFAQAHREGQPLGPALARATALYTSVCWPFFGFIALCAPEIIHLLFGRQWAAAAPLASLLALAALPAALYEMVPQLLSATGHVRRRLRLAAWVAPAHIAGVLLAALHSLQAVAAVSFFSSLLMLALARSQLRAVLGLRYRALLGPSAASLGLALGAGGVMFATAWGLRQLGGPAPAVLGGTLLGGAAAWWACARALNHPALHELSALAKRLQMRRKAD